MTATERAVDLTLKAALAASDKKAEDILALDVSAQMPLADVFLLATGSNERQVAAIAEGIEEALLASGVKAIRREGMREGRWALMDFNDVIVHVMHQEDRAYYSLERLWKDCPVVPLPDEL
ncbi:ribosome silencing factor [Demequina sp. TTPB684]|uniref:ribosome silencing factor n=1 Tax=unclassified Demequina TaxID=2620311 RepID=UPI001CF26DFB|nr:ribosome silencing factor [Demequina sp. TMPB413]MCB2412041.1 ribosome silencing factor [Demequina sp. TTPB684]UPU88853.1 ribosome silencing factor [Demequina sp. TMPB413]